VGTDDDHAWETFRVVLLIAFFWQISCPPKPELQTKQGKDLSSIHDTNNNNS
jgi:hypothetical protein